MIYKKAFDNIESTGTATILNKDDRPYVVLVTSAVRDKNHFVNIWPYNISMSKEEAIKFSVALHKAAELCDTLPDRRRGGPIHMNEAGEYFEI